jgi:threonine aldolase
VDVRALVQDVDSVLFCLSKGLCAPVGSLLCGRADFIAEARRARKVVGGGMRQAGIIAAAGIVALEQMADRVGEDHVRAKQLAHGLAEIPGVDVAPVATNILYFRLAEQVSKTQGEVRDGLAQRGILVGARTDGRFRAATHYWISDEDIQTTVEAVRAVV